METINALHDAFKDAESELEAAKDRLSCLTKELDQYQLFDEKMAGEAASVERLISNSERELIKEQQVLGKMKAASSISQLQREILDRQLEESPRVLMSMTGRLRSRYADETSRIERIQKDADDVMNQAAGVAADDFTQARGIRKMLCEDRRRGQEKLQRDLQTELVEDTDTLQLLRACIDGMIRKNELLRDREEEVAALYGSSAAPSQCELVPSPAPASTPHVSDSAAHRKMKDCQRKHSTAAKSQQQPRKSHAVPHGLREPQQLPPPSASAPWYKFNKKLYQEQVVSHACSSTRTTVVTPHAVMVTKEEAFHSATELLELLEDVK